jgi:hypothetical protein
MGLEPLRNLEIEKLVVILFDQTSPSSLDGPCPLSIADGLPARETGAAPAGDGRRRMSPPDQPFDSTPPASNRRRPEGCGSNPVCTEKKRAAFGW